MEHSKDQFRYLIISKPEKIKASFENGVLKYIGTKSDKRTPKNRNKLSELKKKNEVSI